MQMINENEINLEDSVISTLESEYKEKFDPKILVFGVGGGGVNALNSMVDSDLVNIDNLEFVVANTDYQSLQGSKIKNKIFLGRELTGGIGAGTDPEVGRAAAEESIAEIEKYLEGVNMIFITAGMGGGTGTGAAPVIAKKAREKDILVASIITTPFSVEGSVKMQRANEGIEELKKNVDTLIVVPNQNLFRVSNQDTTLQAALKKVDDILKSGVKSIVDLIKKNGFMNLDFADIRTVMKKIGKAMMGTGEGSGENRAMKAVEEAISNPLLDNISIKGAKGVIINITGPMDTTLLEFENAAKRIKDEIDNEYANIIIGNVFDESLDDTIRVSIFATGIDDEEQVVKDLRIEKNIVNDDKYFDKVTDESIYSKNAYQNNNNDSLDKDDDEYIFNVEKKEVENVDILEREDNKLSKNAATNNFKRNTFRTRIGDENYYKDDDSFDMGESIKYDEFSKKQNIFKAKNLHQEMDNDADWDKKRQVNQERNIKKDGFFSKIFGGGNKKSSNVYVDDADDGDDDLDISFYKKQSYYRSNRRDEE